MVGLEEKLGTDPRITQTGWGLCRELWICLNMLTTLRKIAMCGPREICMVLDHTQTEYGKCLACLSGFPLHVVHRFKSPQLSDMSNRLFVAVIM
jgi:hypothetical protein